MKRLLFSIACISLLGTSPAIGEYIWLNVSVKAVLNPTNGTRFYAFTEAHVDASIAEINRMLGQYQRGYRMRRVDPLLDVGSTNNPGGPSKWFYPNPRDPYPANPAIRNQEQMENEALADPLAYRWNSSALNFYVVAGLGASQTDTNGNPVGQPAGESSFPSSGRQIITLGTVHFPLVILHEAGHWYELYHTQGSCGRDQYGACGSAAACPIVKNGFRLGDDTIADTLPVQAGDFCFTNQNLIALANFGIPYGSCTAEQAQQVDDAFFNLEAYGFDRVMDRLTPQQLDRLTDYANSSRAFASSGLTRYVSAAGNNANTGLRSDAPKRTVLNAVNSSSAGGTDTVLLRPGSYNEQITMNRPVTLRVAPTNSFSAYHRWATIGR